MSVSVVAPDDESSRVDRRIGQTDEVRRALGLDSKSRWKKRIVWAVVLAAIGVLATFVVVKMTAPEPPTRWQTAAVTRGELTTTVTATGALKPVRTVTIAAEISGRIIAVAVEENDEVRVGQVLVEIDTERLRTQLAQAKAQAAVARALTHEARATVTETREQLTRMQSLAKSNLVSAGELTTAKASYGPCRSSA